MTFLQPFILWGLPLALVPVIIHLLNRMRHRPQPWAAMRFLIAATRSSTSHARLRQWLILLCRVLAVLALVVFMARPLAGGWLGWALSPAPDAVLILLDRSASMEARAPGTSHSKRLEALDRLAEAAKPFEEKSHLILIDSALMAPQELAKADYLKATSLAGATDTAADIPGLFSAAARWLLDNRSGNAEIWIASDLQRSNWNPDDSRWAGVRAQLQALPEKIRIRLLALDQSAGPDKSIALRELGERGPGQTNTLETALEIRSRTAGAEALPVTQSFNGSRSQIEAQFEGRSLLWHHRINLRDSAPRGWGAFTIPDDANARNNSAYFVYAPESAWRATLIRSDRASGEYLHLALAASAAQSSSAVAEWLPSQFTEITDQSLLVWQGPLPEGVTAAKIRQFIEEGGVALFFPAGESSANQFLNLRWGDAQSAPPDHLFKLTQWQNDHGPLARTEEGWALPVSDLEIRRRQKIEGDSSETLASFSDRAPFLVKQDAGRGHAYFCATLPNPSWSSLAEGAVLVPMTQRALLEGSRRLQMDRFADCGRLSPADRARRWQSVDSAAPKDIRTQAGVYKSGDRWLAVNRPAAEDDFETISTRRAQALFGAIPNFLWEEQNRSAALHGEVWRAFLACMLAFLTGEALLILPPRRDVRPAARRANAAAFAAASK